MDVIITAYAPDMVIEPPLLSVMDAALAFTTTSHTPQADSPSPSTSVQSMALAENEAITSAKRLHEQEIRAIVRDSRRYYHRCSCQYGRLLQSSAIANGRSQPKRNTMFGDRGNGDKNKLVVDLNISSVREANDAQMRVEDTTANSQNHLERADSVFAHRGDGAAVYRDKAKAKADYM